MISPPFGVSMRFDLFAFAIMLSASLWFAPVSSALAQEATINFGGIRQDASLPVEVTSDMLTVDQADGSAVFSGNVLVKQGDMRLSAGEVRVEYGTDGQKIEKLVATGGVTLVSPQDAAQSDAATYVLADSSMVMTGNVLLTQGNAAIRGQQLNVNLADGTGRMSGRVTTVFSPSGGNP